MPSTEKKKSYEKEPVTFISVRLPSLEETFTPARTLVEAQILLACFSLLYTHFEPHYGWGYQTLSMMIRLQRNRRLRWRELNFFVMFVLAPRLVPSAISYA